MRKTSVPVPQITTHSYTLTMHQQPQGSLLTFLAVLGILGPRVSFSFDCRIFSFFFSRICFASCRISIISSSSLSGSLSYSPAASLSSSSFSNSSSFLEEIKWKSGCSPNLTYNPQCNCATSGNTTSENLLSLHLPWFWSTSKPDEPNCLRLCCLHSQLLLKDQQEIRMGLVITQKCCKLRIQSISFNSMLQQTEIRWVNFLLLIIHFDNYIPSGNSHRVRKYNFPCKPLLW